MGQTEFVIFPGMIYDHAVQFADLFDSLSTERGQKAGVLSAAESSDLLFPPVYFPLMPTPIPIEAFPLRCRVVRSFSSGDESV